MTPVPRSLPAFLALGALVACGDKDGTDDTASAACTVAVADAGVDATGAVGSAITLDASGSEVCAAFTSDGSASYKWTFDRVPVDSRVDNSSFSVREGADAVTTSFTPDVAGDYVVSLTITDPAGTSSADIIVISVDTDNAAPIASCGDDQSAQVGERVEFDGSDSYDPDGAEVEHLWSLAVTPDCSSLESTDIYNADQPVGAVVADCEGLYLVSLVVSDGDNWSEPDYCTLDVADGNRLPEADAGESLDLPYCAPNPLHLNGWGSYDLDGDDLTYLWTVVSVPALSSVTDADFDDATAEDPQIEWDVPGAYTFELQVHDGESWSAPDLVTYTIAGLETNTSPIANAGTDQTISTQGSCVSSSYVWTCLDCPEASTILDGSSSYDPDGDDIYYQWSEATGLATFSNNRSAVTDVIVPPQPSEFGVDNEIEFEVELEVQDCLEVDTDMVTVTYTCTGEYLGE